MLLLGVYQLLGGLRELVPGLRRAADARGLEEIGVVEEGDGAALDRQVVLLATPLLMEGGRNVREELRRFWAKWEYVSSRIDKLKEGGK